VSFRRFVLWICALAMLMVVFNLYLQPDLAMTLANQIWNCF